MSNDDANDSKEEEVSGKKKRYETPRLVEYGRAVDLTGGLVGSVAENSGFPKMKFP